MPVASRVTVLEALTWLQASIMASKITRASTRTKTPTTTTTTTRTTRARAATATATPPQTKKTAAKKPVADAGPSKTALKSTKSAKLVMDENAALDAEREPIMVSSAFELITGLALTSWKGLPAYQASSRRRRTLVSTIFSTTIRHCSAHDRSSS